MLRWRRRLAIVAILLILAIVGLRLFLHSSLAANVVADDLGDLLDTNVKIGTLRASLLGDTVVCGVQFSDQHHQPFLEAEQITVDVSLGSVLRGKKLPQRIDVEGVTLRLRFDRRGRLLTQLPKLPQTGQLPELRLRNLTLTLEQQGRPPLTLRRASATLSPKQVENLTGWIDDPLVGRFELGGQFGPGKLHLRLVHGGFPLSPERFAQLPFLPEALSERIHVEGEVPFALELYLAATEPRCRYRLRFGPAITHLKQPHRPDERFAHVLGTVEGEDDHCTFVGDVEDPTWGKWQVDCLWVNPRVDLRLNSPTFTFDPALLRRIPYVSESVWQQFEATGRSTVSAHVHLDVDKSDLHYRVELKPELYTACFPVFDLRADKVRGNVVLEDHVVQLQNVRAEVAHGDVALVGRMDVAGDNPTGDLQIEASGLDFSSFPESWEIPPRVRGYLSGGARLAIESQGNALAFDGEGLGRLDDVQLFEHPLQQPVHWALHDRAVNVRIDESALDLASLSKSIGTSLNGRAEVRARLTFPLDQAPDPTSWHAVAHLRSRAVEIHSTEVQNVAVDLSLREGRVRIVDARAELAGGIVRAEGEGSIDPCQGKGHIFGHGFDLPRGLALHDVRSDVVLDREGISFNDVRLDVPGGSVTGWGQFRWSDRALRVDGFARDVDAALALRALLQRPHEVEGTVSAQLSAVVRADEPALLQLDLVSDRLTAWNVPIQNLRGRLDLARSQLSYQLSAETLSGRVTLQGRQPPREDEPSGLLRFEHLQLGTLWNVMRVRGPIKRLQGNVELNLPFRFEESEPLPTGRGRFAIQDLKWGNSELMDQFAGDLILDEDGVTVRDAGGILAGGNARLNGNWRFSNRARSWVNVRVLGADLSRVASLKQDLGDVVDGPLDLSLRADLGTEWRGSGALSLLRGKVFGIEVSDWRIPLDFSYVPATQQGELAIRESTAQIGSGRAQLRASLRHAGFWRLEGQLKFFDAGLRSLAGFVGDFSSVARGRVTGRIDFAAPELRSLNDLTANVRAKLNDAQALQLPILRLVVPHVLPGRGSLDFQAGQLTGRLANGVFRISEWTLDSTLLLLLIQGSVTLQGRLDLEVMAQTTSTGIDPVVLRGMLRWLPPVGPIPVGVLVRITEAMSDRVLHLRIGGSVKSPRVQVEPLRLLSDQAARFFLNRAMQSVQP